MDIIFTLTNCRMWQWHVYGHTRCVRGDQSPHCSAWLVEWEYALINPMRCVGQSPLLAIANNLTTKVNNNTKRSLCPQKGRTEHGNKGPKGHTCISENAPAMLCIRWCVGSDKHNKIRCALLTKEWKMKSKSTKKWNCGRKSVTDKNSLLTTLSLNC